MLQKIIKTYSELLDEKLENWTLVILIIALLIVWVSIMVTNSEIKNYNKNNLLEIKQSITNKDNLIEIKWVKYKVTLEELPK